MTLAEEASKVLSACLTLLGILVGSVAIYFNQLQSLPTLEEFSGPAEFYTRLLSALTLGTGLVTLIAFLTMIAVLQSPLPLRLSFGGLISGCGVVVPALIYLSV